MGGLSLALGILPPLPTNTRYAFAGDVQNIQRGMIPRIYGRSYSIEAALQVPRGGAEGVIVANADFIGGFALWVDSKGRLNHTYSLLGVETYKQTARRKLPAGEVTVRMLFDADEPKPGTGGSVSLYANDEQIGKGRIAQTVPLAFTRATPAWTLAATTASSLTAPTRTKPLTRSPRRQAGHLRPQTQHSRGRKGTARSRAARQPRTRSRRLTDSHTPPKTSA